MVSPLQPSSKEGHSEAQDSQPNLNVFMEWWYYLDILHYKASLVDILTYQLKEQFLKVISTLKIIVTYLKIGIAIEHLTSKYMKIYCCQAQS